MYLSVKLSLTQNVHSATESNPDVLSSQDIVQVCDMSILLQWLYGCTYITEYC